jgi:hypothetical protein
VDKVFNLVHEANMNKKFPDGTFHKNDEGKIIKPPNWVEPNVVEEVAEWIKHGTWTNCSSFKDALQKNTDLTSTLSNLIHNFKNIVSESDDYIESDDIHTIREEYKLKQQYFQDIMQKNTNLKSTLREEYELKQQFREESEQLKKEDAELQKELDLLANLDFDTM